MIARALNVAVSLEPLDAPRSTQTSHRSRKIKRLSYVLRANLSAALGE